MAVAHTTVLEMLGKDVSFIHQRKFELIDTSFVTLDKTFTGTVTDVILSVIRPPEISINSSDFFIISDLLDLKLI